MIRSIISLIAKGYLYVRQHPELLMTLLMLCVIPIAFLLNSKNFLDVSMAEVAEIESERIGSIHDLFISIIIISEFDPEVIQDEITKFARINEDIDDFMVVREQGPYLDIVAALDISMIGQHAENQDKFRSANVDPHTSITFPYAENGVRYTFGYRLVPADGGSNYYIFTKVDHSIIDSHFATRARFAYIWLFALLTIVILLVLRHARLIDYAYLYSETKKMNETKDMFTNMIAHELRAPLTAMRGYASMIFENKEVSEDTRKYAHNIEDAAERLVLVVNDLLDVARIHSGKLSISPSDTNIQEVVSVVLESMQSTAQEKNIMLSQDTKIYPIKMFIDGKRFHQALTNLVSNAIKYTQAGSITLSIDDRDDRVEIRVKDTGMGISAENQKNLFAPFFRVQIPEVDNTVGTGLGMWITKHLIELMGGSIAVESIKGVGTHVVVTLPKVTYLKEPNTSK